MRTLSNSEPSRRPEEENDERKDDVKEFRSEGAIIDARENENDVETNDERGACTSTVGVKVRGVKGRGIVPATW